MDVWCQSVLLNKLLPRSQPSPDKNCPFELQGAAYKVTIIATAILSALSLLLPSSPSSSSSSSSCILLNQIIIIFTFVLRSWLIFTIYLATPHSTHHIRILLKTFKWHNNAGCNGNGNGNRNKKSFSICALKFCVCVSYLGWEFDRIQNACNKNRSSSDYKKHLSHHNSLEHWIRKMFYYPTNNEYCFELCSLDTLVPFFLFNLLSCLCLVYSTNGSSHAKYTVFGTIYSFPLSLQQPPCYTYCWQKRVFHFLATNDAILLVFG